MTGKIHEIKELRNRKYIFQDRAAAGKILADMLSRDFAGLKNGLVMAIPSGGVPVGLEVSSHLGLSFDMIIVRKLQIPGNTEAGFGALTLDGELFLNEEMLSGLHLSREQIDQLADQVRWELKARNELFRENRPAPEIAGKAIFLIDDGLASGYTMLAAVNSVKKQGAGKIVVAVPTSPLTTIKRVSPEVDDIYSAHIQDYGPFAVASAYQHWHDLSRQEVITLVRQQPQDHPHL